MEIYYLKCLLLTQKFKQIQREHMCNLDVLFNAQTCTDLHVNATLIDELGNYWSNGFVWVLCVFCGNNHLGSFHH